MLRNEKNNIKAMVNEQITQLIEVYKMANSSQDEESTNLLALKIVETILSSIMQLKSKDDSTYLINKYPEGKNHIAKLISWRFPTESKNVLLQTTEGQNENMADLIPKYISEYLSHIGIKIRFMEMSTTINNQTNALRAQTDHLQKEINKLDEDIEAKRKTIQKLEEERKPIREQLHLKMGIISDKDRDEWINESSFKQDLVNIQKIIERLDSRFVFDGRNKAKKIKTALNAAIDAGLKGHHFESFRDFTNYKKGNYGVMFSQTEPSLAEVLKTHRFELLDKLFGKDNTKSSPSKK